MGGINIPGLAIKSFEHFKNINKFQVAALHILSNAMKDIDPAQSQRVAKTFKAIDADDNGEISLDEFLAAMTSDDTGFDTKQATAMFKQLDVDGDNKLVKSEMMLSITQKMLCDRQERLYAAFTHLDTNGDGFIDQSEMAAALSNSSSASQESLFAFLGDPAELIALVDANKDGKISLAEWYEALDPPVHKDQYKLDHTVELAGKTIGSAEKKSLKRTHKNLKEARTLAVRSLAAKMKECMLKADEGGVDAMREHMKQTIESKPDELNSTFHAIEQLDVEIHRVETLLHYASSDEDSVETRSSDEDSDSQECRWDRGL